MSKILTPDELNNLKKAINDTTGQTVLILRCDFCNNEMEATHEEFDDDYFVCSRCGANGKNISIYGAK